MNRVDRAIQDASEAVDLVLFRQRFAVKPTSPAAEVCRQWQAIEDEGEEARRTR